jgi:hypothetical protein
MNLGECARESSVLAALQSNCMPEELAAHLDSCPVCRDAQLVWSYLEGCASAERETEIVAAGTVWWRAQLAKKRATAQRSIAWIDLMQKISLTVAVMAAIAVGAWQAPKMFEVPPLLLAGSAGVLILLLASLVVVFGLERNSLRPRGM